MWSAEGNTHRGLRTLALLTNYSPTGIWAAFISGYLSCTICYLTFKNFNNVPLKLKRAAETAVPNCENFSLIVEKLSISKCRNTNTDFPPENVYMGERTDVGNTHCFHHTVFKINTKYHQHCKRVCGANKEKIPSYQSKTLHSYFPPKEMIKIEKQTTNKNPRCEQQRSCCLTSGGKVSKHPQHRPLRLNWHPTWGTVCAKVRALLSFYQIFLKTLGFLTKCLSLPIYKRSKRFHNTF